MSSVSSFDVLKTMLLLIAGFSTLLWAMNVTAQRMLIAPRARIVLGDYRVSFDQLGWSFSTATIAQESSLLGVIKYWKTVHIKERYGSNPWNAWGYSMDQISNWPEEKLRNEASELINRFRLTTQDHR